MDKIDRICNNIKSLKIQGAENIAIAGVKALLIKNDVRSIKKIVSARPTEPALRNAVYFAKSDPKKMVPKVLKHFNDSGKIIAEFGSGKIINRTIVFTHCHSSTVMEILRQAKKQGKSFDVHNTETRPLYQGRVTSKELAKLNINVKHYIDSAARFALKGAGIMLIGADAITADGKVINKIGSEMMCEIAEKYSIPVYVATNSWKFDPLTLHELEEPIEERSGKEVWPNRPKGVEIVNPAFEKIDPKLITGIISELGILKPKEFISAVHRAYPWMRDE